MAISFSQWSAQQQGANQSTSLQSTLPKGVPTFSSWIQQNPQPKQQLTETNLPGHPILSGMAKVGKFLGELPKNTVQALGYAEHREVGGLQNIVNKHLPATAQSIQNIVSNPLSLPPLKELPPELGQFQQQHPVLAGMARIGQTMGEFPKKLYQDTIGQIYNTDKEEIQRVADLFTKPGTTSQTVARGIKATTGAANVLFSPISAFFSGASDIPVIGTLAKIATLPFAAGGDVGQQVFSRSLDALPLQKETKDNLRDAVNEVGTLAGQLVIGGKLFSMGEKWFADAKSKLMEKYNNKDATTIIKQAQQKAQSTVDQIELNPNLAADVIKDAKLQLEGKYVNQPKASAALDAIDVNGISSWGDLYTKMMAAVGDNPAARSTVINHLGNRWKNAISEPELSAKIYGPEFVQLPKIESIPTTEVLPDKGNYKKLYHWEGATEAEKMAQNVFGADYRPAMGKGKYFAEDPESGSLWGTKMEKGYINLDKAKILDWTTVSAEQQSQLPSFRDYIQSKFSANQDALGFAKSQGYGGVKFWSDDGKFYHYVIDDKVIPILDKQPMKVSPPTTPQPTTPETASTGTTPPFIAPLKMGEVPKETPKVDVLLKKEPIATFDTPEEAQKFVDNQVKAGGEKKSYSIEPRKTVPKTEPKPTEVPKEIPATPEVPTPETPTYAPTIKENKLAVDIERQAIEKNLVDEFRNMPEYDVMNMADQARKAMDILLNDAQLAHDIAMGKRLPPGDVQPGSVYVAVKADALRRNDVQTLLDLATNSRLVGQATAAGQFIKSFDDHNPTDPVSAIQTIVKERETAVERKTKMKIDAVRKETVNEIRMEVKKTTTRQSAWTAFVDSIKC